MDNKINNYPRKSKIKKEIILKTQENYNLYTTNFKKIFENINYYISKKNPYYKEIQEKTELYRKKISTDYDLNGDKYIPIIIKSLYLENYKLAKYVLSDLIILIKNNFILGLNDVIKYKTDLSSFLIKEVKFFTNENIFNKKLSDLFIIILTNLDEIYHDNDIWLYLSECLSEVIHNINMISNICNEAFKKIYEFYFRVYNKFEEDEIKQKIIKNDLIYFINYKLNLFFKFYNSEINSLFSNDNTYSNYLKNIYNQLNNKDYIENSKSKNYNPIDLLVCRTVKYIVDTICFRYDEKKNNNNSINNFEKNQLHIIVLNIIYLYAVLIVKIIFKKKKMILIK